MIKAVLFDWGNTVMYDFDEYQHLGAMVNWPVVEVVPGIEDALRALQPDYTLAIVTNAQMSTGEQVRAALARGGLDSYFPHIWSALDMGVSKPSQAYFDIVLGDLGIRADEAVLVGDTFTTDVAGAKQHGLRAVWYNAAGHPVPPEGPAPDAIVRDLSDLDAAIRSLA